MIPALGALGGGGFSQSGSADANTQFGQTGFGGFGGINTGRQGVDLTTLAVIAGAALIGLLLLRMR